jgi:peptidyl-prolyl cis-trans isomerase C
MRTPSETPRGWARRDEADQALWSSGGAARRSVPARGWAPGIAMRLLREPLVHFLMAGGLLFAVDAARPKPATPSDHVIQITEAEIDRLRMQWTKQYQRPPELAELEDLIDARVREEVLYREALAMGLDQDDSIVRRRLAQKLEFLIEDVAAAHEPTHAELSAFFDKRQERYRLPARISFSQVYFSRNRRGRAAESDAGLVLAGLGPAILPAAAADQGDRFIMGASYSEQSPEDVETAFGPEFVRALFEIEPGGWSGPIASAYGWHLVRIEAQSSSRLPRLAEVADHVRHDWSYEQRRKANEAVYERLAARYELRIEDGARRQSAAVTLGLDAEVRP